MRTLSLGLLCAALASATLASATLASAAPGTATGKLTIQGKTFDLKHAYANEVPDGFDKSKNAVQVLLTSAPVDEEAVTDSGLLMDLYGDGKFHGLKCEFRPGDSAVNIQVLSNLLGGSISLSKSGGDVPMPHVFTATRIEGAVNHPESTLGDWTYSFEANFAADITPRSIEPEPTPADTAAAKGHPATKAFLALLAAIHKGDKAGILALAPPDQREMIDGPDFAETLKFIQAITPKEVTVLKVTENGPKATLRLSGVEEGETVRGKAFMEKDGGGVWRMVRQSWGE
jgi:hypothetical protein